MSKEDFKKMFAELLKSKEIDFDICMMNDGHYWLRIEVDGERIFEQYLRLTG